MATEPYDDSLEDELSAELQEQAAALPCPMAIMLASAIPNDLIRYRYLNCSEDEAKESMDDARAKIAAAIDVHIKQLVFLNVPEITDERLDAMPTDDMTILFARCQSQKRDLKASMEQLEDLIGAKSSKRPEDGRLQGRLKKIMTEKGIPNLRARGFTVYLHRQIWARRAEGVTQAEMNAALREAGMDGFVFETVNTQTLSAHVRTLPENATTGLPELPPELEKAISVTDDIQVRARKAS